MVAEQTGDVTRLLADLESAGVELWLEDTKIRYRAPRGTMTEPRLAALRERRDEITAALRLASQATAVRHDASAAGEPFPLTAVQAAYVTGRSPGYRYGGVGCHGYGELRFEQVRPDRLDAAWAAVVARHDMLRTVLCGDGMQQVQPGLPHYQIAVTDLGDASEREFREAVQATRAQMDHRVYDPARWPLFDLRLTKSDGPAILHFSIDFLIADFVSLQILLRELEAEYASPGSLGVPAEITFRDLQVSAQQARSGPAARADRAYWWDRIDDMPDPPELPLLDAGDGRPRFRRLAASLPARQWSRLREAARAAQVTPSCCVLAAYAEVIRRWSKRPDFTLNVTVLNRPPVHPQVGDIVGDFTTIELLAVTGAGASFGDRARQVQARLWEDLDHPLCSGIDVMRELRKRRGDGLNLFPIVFTSSVGIATGQADLGMGRLVHGISQTPQVWLDCQVTERGGGLDFNWDMRESVLDPAVADAMFDAFAGLLARLAEDAAAWESRWPVPVPAAQRSSRPLPPETVPADPAGLHDGVLVAAARQPDRTAVLAGPVRLSYGELIERATAAALAIGEAGAGPGSVVAILMDKGWEQVVAVLGAMLAGCAYVPADTAQPPRRRLAIVADSGASLVLTQSWRRDDCQAADLPVICVDGLEPAAPGDESACPHRGGRDLAYIMYTSGSTGTPKGVMISHQAALGTITDINRRFAVSQDDRVLGLASLGFDLSVYDIFGTLSAGGTLVLPDAGRRGDPAHWAALVDQHKVTIWNSVPAQLEMLVAALRGSPDTGLPSLRLALVSGDWIPVTLPDAAAEHLPGMAMVSLGGATEAAIWSIIHPIDGSERGLASIPYGRPLDGQAVEVLGADLHPVPDLVTGEIWIWGAGLADGYLGDPEKTAARFIDSPLTGQRMYRTGDLGRYLPGGEIEFLGREDSQVKIRGHRVELAEIQAALASHPAVAAAAVVVTGTRPDPLALAGFVQPAPRPAGAWPDPGHAATLRNRALSAAAGLREQVDDCQMLAFAKALDDTALLQMLTVLRGAGLFASPADRHSLAEILERARVAPSHRRLIQRWLRALADNGLLSQDAADGYYFGAAHADAAAVADGWAKVQRNLPDAETRTELISYFRATADNLPALVSGEQDPLTMLFPEGQTQIHEVAYNAMFVSRYLNRLLTSAACQLAEQAAGAGPVRVLEIGSGVGGTSVELIPALAAFDVEYLFTDVSEFFLANARRRYAEYGWVGYRRYDMNEDFRAQGLAPNYFDIVVCANVLHYARDADRVLRTIRQLLVPGGWLLFIEATKDSYQIMTSMEFLFDEGSGEFTDVRRLDAQTFISREQWLEILRDGGADAIAAMPEHDPITDAMGMHAFAARFKSHLHPVRLPSLSAHVAELVPDHMVPARLQVVDELPLTGNGKIDTRTLTAWAGAGPAARAAVDAAELPAGPAEEAIARILRQLLRTEQVGRRQGFFELGGDSLLAAQVATEIRQGVPQAAGIFYDDLLRMILDNATIAGLAEQLSARQAAPAPAAASPGSPVVHLADGAGRDLILLVHDGTGALAAYQPLTQSLHGSGALAGLVVRDSEAYLAMPAHTLTDVAAAGYVQALCAEGWDRVAVVGHGSGDVLAAEVARQLQENGVLVTRLVLIDPATADSNGGEPREAGELFLRETGSPPAGDDAVFAVFEHSLAAARAHDLLPYAGDITLVAAANGGMTPGMAATVEFWREACLGDVQVVELDAGHGGLVTGAAPAVAALLASAQPDG